MLKAYVDLISQPSRALFMFLKITKIPHTIVPVAVLKGEQLGQQYTKINPFRLVPAIDDDGFVLTESIPILQYLCNKYQVDDSLYPRDLQKRARVDCFTSWYHLNLRFGGGGLTLALIQPLMKGKPVDEKRLEITRRSLKQSLDKMESIFLKDTPFLYSETMTIADILAISEVMQPKMGLGMDIDTNRPKLSDWVERCRETIGTELFDDTHKFIKQTSDIFKQMDFPIPKL